MRAFDVTLKGFDGGTDQTDNLVKWVRAENKATVELWLKRLGLDHVVRDITDIGYHATTFEDGINVILSPVMPDPGTSCQVRNFGDFYQITRGDFYPQTWIAESEHVISQ